MQVPKNIKERLDKLSIEEIEKRLKNLVKNLNQTRMELIMTLFYLESYSRYKENAFYSRESFKFYLKNFIRISSTMYEADKWAFAIFPKESQRWGPGIIIKIKNICGRLRTQKVILEMRKFEKEKRRPILNEEAEKIILRYKKDEVSAEEVSYIYNETKAELKAVIAENDLELRNLRAQDSEKDKQIAKLKSAVRRKNKEIAELRSENEDLRQTLEGKDERRKAAQM